MLRSIYAGLLEENREGSRERGPLHFRGLHGSLIRGSRILSFYILLNFPELQEVSHFLSLEVLQVLGQV